jgi:hypothetical protein
MKIMLDFALTELNFFGHLDPELFALGYHIELLRSFF